MLSIEAIRAASDIPTEVVPVPEWGADATILVRGLTKAQTAAIFAAATIEGEPGKDGKPTKTVDPQILEDELLLACVIEPKLQREDLTMLAEKANAPVQRVALACVRVAGLGEEGLKKAKS